MDLGQELATNNHAQDQTASHRKKRSKINGAAEAPPAKRIKSSTDSARLRVSRTSRASTARTRAAKLGDSKWITVVPSIERQVPSDLVLVDARPRLWSMNRAELGSAFVEISDSKCVNGISWTLTDMPIVVLDNESMVLEKSKDAGDELSMDLVLIREIHYTNPNTFQKDEDSVVDYPSPSRTKDDSKPVHRMPSMPEKFPDGPPEEETPPPIHESRLTTATIPTPIPPPRSECKPNQALQEQGLITEKSANRSLTKIPLRTPQNEPRSIITEDHLDPTPLLSKENPVSQSAKGGQPSKGPQKTAGKPLLIPVQDVTKSEELENSNDASVFASATDHGSATLADIPSSVTADKPKPKWGRQPKVQQNPSDESVPDPEKAVSRSKGQGKPVFGPPPASTKLPDSSKFKPNPTAKSEQRGERQEASPKSTNKAPRDTAWNLLQPKKQENVDETLPVPTTTHDPSDSTATPNSMLRPGGRIEASPKPDADPPDSAQGVSQPKAQDKPNEEIQHMDTPISDHAESISTARSKIRKLIPKSRKTVGHSADKSLLEQPDTGCLSHSNTGVKSKGAKGRQRKDTEKDTCERPELGSSTKSRGEGIRQSEKATKGPSKRARSPGISATSSSARARKSNSDQKERGAPVRGHHPKSASQLPQKKGPAAPIQKDLSTTVQTPWDALGGGRNSAYKSLRFTKKKDTTTSPAVSDNNAEVPRTSGAAVSAASVFASGSSAPTVGDVRDPPNKNPCQDSYSNKEVLLRSTPDLPMSAPGNILQEQNNKDSLYNPLPDDRNLPYLGNILRPPAPVGEVTQHVLSEPVTQQIKIPSNHSLPATSNSLPEQGPRKGPEAHSKSGALRSLRFKKYKEAPMHVFIPKTSENTPGVPQSVPEKQPVKLNGHPPRHHTPDRSMREPENIVRGQEGHFDPGYNHFPDNRSLPNFDRLSLGFVEKHDTSPGVQTTAGGAADFGGLTRNQMDTRRDDYWAGNVQTHVDPPETHQGWAAGWGPPHRNQTPLGRLPESGAPQREPCVDKFIPSRRWLEAEMRRTMGSRWEAPLVQKDHGAPRRTGYPAFPGDLRAHSHSPVPTSSWILPGLDKRPKSAPYDAKPPPLGPRAWLELQKSNLEIAASVTGVSHNQVVALSGLRNMYPDLQGIGGESAATITQIQPSLTPATCSIKDVAMVSLPDEPTPPASSTQPLQSVAPALINACLSPIALPANDVIMGSSTDDPPVLAPTAPIPIEPTHVSAIPSHAPQVTAAVGIPTDSQTNKPAPPTSTEQLPPSATAPPLSLKRKGKEKAPPLECSDDESFTMQDEIRQAKKTKVWHDPIVDIDRIFINLNTPMACSSKTKLEDLPALQSGETPSQASAMAVDDQTPSLSISSSSVKAPKRRGHPPKSAKVTLSGSEPTMTITPGLPRGKFRERQSPSLSNSVLRSTCSSQALPRVADVAVRDQSLLSSVSMAAKPAKRRGRPPKVVASPSVPVRSGSTLDELPSISGALHTTPLKTPLESLSSATPVQLREDGVPLPIPVEIQALVDAYINGVPIGVFASNSYIQGFWGLKLARGEEIGYAFMGFYRVCRVLESLDEGGVYNEGGKETKGKGSAVVTSEVSKTRVHWRLKLRWEPGGEGWQIRDSQRLSSPWWNSNLNAKELTVVPRNGSDDSDDESTETYRLARRTNQNFLRRHYHFDQTFCSVLPLHLLAPINAEIPDAVLPRGWHCPDCGKLNFRYYLRHRRCDSSYCRDKSVAQGYMVEVDRLRDPQDATPLSLPLNIVPDYIRSKSLIQVWNDKMKTLVYCFETTITGAMVRVQHIFTCNLVDLQRVPSELFNSIQMDVPLKRPAGDAHMYPYFMHTVDEVQGKGEDSSSWMTAPQSLHRAKEVMTSRGRTYGKKTAAELDINKLVIRAWVTSGSKRGSELLQAKERCIVVMCLGCEVILSISPKSAMPPNDNQTRLPDLDKLIQMESLDPPEDQLTKPEPEENTILNLGEKGGQPHLVSASSTVREVMGKNQRGEKVEMTLSLVHGDVVLLEGDDFEYSIKRTGTSILLFGLPASSRHPRQAADSGRG